MKTIFLTISRGFLARNILQTGIVRQLLDAGHRVVMATPAWQDPEFLAEFAHPRLSFVPLFIPPWKTVDKFFGGLHHNLVWNRSIKFSVTYGVYDPNEVPWWRAPLQQVFWRPLAAVAPFKPFARWLDARVCPPPAEQVRQLEEIRPDVVFLTNPMEYPETYYTKAARSLGIPSVGLVKSWDNMSKTSFRALTDFALVWGPYMTREAHAYQGFAPDCVFECGVPQFDQYVRKEGLRSRTEMLSSFGLDPSRKTILFGSEGKVTPTDPDIVEGMRKMLERGELAARAQVLVRPHFGYKKDDEKFAVSEGKPHVAVDHANTPRLAFYDQWDYSRGHYVRLAETLYASDLVVTTASTLAIDAIACGRPCIAIAFDGFAKKPHRESVARWYETEYTASVVETGALCVVRNWDELRAALNAHLSDPGLRGPERAHLLSHFAGRLDGHASERVAAFVGAVAETGKAPAREAWASVAERRG